MYSKILVPLDFSEQAINALQYAMAFAKSQKAKLVLLHAYDIPIPSAEMGMTIDENLAENFEKEADKKFKDLYRQFPDLGMLVALHKIKLAFPADAILEEISNSDIDLTIMGTHGAHNALEELLGSNTLRVARKSPKPVLAIPSNAKLDKIQEVLFAYDYESVSNGQVVQPLTDFARYFRAKIKVLYITEKIKKLDQDAVNEARHLEEYLKDIPHQYHMLVATDIEEGIDQFLQEHKADILAVMPRKHKLWDRIFKSSVTRKLIHHSKVPLLVFPQSDTA